MPYLIVLLLAASVLPSAAAQTPFAFREIDGRRLELSDGGKTVFVYNFGMIGAKGFPDSMQRSGYLHPVYAPDGTRLTDDFNANHPHHRGIFWAWPEVSVGGKKGDVWTVKGPFERRFVRWQARQADAATARLAVENGWFDGPRKVLKEEFEILTHAVAGRQRTLEFTLRFEATAEPVTIAGTPDGHKGFGGFAFRFAPLDGGANHVMIRTEQGVSAKDGVMARHPWAQLSGSFQGHAAGARIEDLPSNPGYPHNGWLMRHGLLFLNVSYPGLQPLVLVPGKPLVLHYKVILFAGEALP